MLEEGFKAIEGPVTRRLNKETDPWVPLSSQAYQPGISAAVEVLHLDVLLCEDAASHNRPFCRIPADYEKFFNTVQLSSVDTVHQCRGVPDAARRLYQSAFQGEMLEKRAAMQDRIYHRCLKSSQTCLKSSRPCRISIPEMLGKLTAMQDRMPQRCLKSSQPCKIRFQRCLKSSQPCRIGCPRDA